MEEVAVKPSPICLPSIASELLPHPHGAVEDRRNSRGRLADILYYIIGGSVEVMIEDEDGNEMVLAYLNKGQFFGEMGLFYEQRRAAPGCARASSASSQR